MIHWILIECYSCTWEEVSIISSVIKLSVTSDDGRFSIPAEAGKYLLSVSHIGYTPLYTSHFEVSGSGETTVPALSMAKAGGEMKGVTVTAQKPIIEVKADKTILNVEGTINAIGNDALELLRRAPGVMIDKDDGISLAGKNGVVIYIDGKD